MGLLLWGCKTAATGEKICTFSKSNQAVEAVVQAGSWDKIPSLPTKIWYTPAPDTQSDGAGSDLPTDDDDSAVGKALSLQRMMFPAPDSEKKGTGWRYVTAYQPPVRPAITPPPPQA